MKALVLAAGYGTRLHPLTANVPKALLPIHGVPLIEYILAKLTQAGDIDEIYVVSNAKFYGQFQDWCKTCMVGADLHVYNDGSKSESDRLGAVRDIQFALEQANIQDDLLIVAGDNLFDLDVRAFFEFAREKNAPCIAVKDIADRKLAVRYGVVELGADGRVVSFVEKSPNPPSSLVSTCLYYLPKAALARIAEFMRSGEPADAPGNLIQWLARQQPVYGWVFRETWFDIGDRESYEAANAVYAARANKD